MSSRTARVLLDVESPSVTLRQLVRLPVTSVIGHNLYAELVAELGSAQAAVFFLVDLAAEVQHPLLVNLETAEGSSTLAIAPSSWGQERLDGWTAGHHQELEAMFGPATVRAWGKGQR